MRIIPFGLIWVIGGLIYSLLERGLLGNLFHYPSTGNPYNFVSTLWITAVTAFLLGLFFGSIEILYFSRIFEEKSLSENSFIKQLSTSLLISASFLSIRCSIIQPRSIREFLTEWFETCGYSFQAFLFGALRSYIAAVIGVTLFIQK